MRRMGSSGQSGITLATSEGVGPGLRTVTSRNADKMFGVIQGPDLVRSIHQVYTGPNAPVSMVAMTSGSGNTFRPLRLYVAAFYVSTPGRITTMIQRRSSAGGTYPKNANYRFGIWENIDKTFYPGSLL